MHLVDESQARVLKWVAMKYLPPVSQRNNTGGGGGGYTPTRSQSQLGGTPIHPKGGGYLHPLLMGGTPARSGWGYPLPIRTGWGYPLPPPRRQSSSCYGGGGANASYVHAGGLSCCVLIFHWS